MAAFVIHKQTDMMMMMMMYCACVSVSSAAKTDLGEPCNVDRQCSDINAVCENSVCSCRPRYTAQQSTCGT